VRRSLAFLLVVIGVLALGPSASASGTWAWPVTGPVVRGFDPPDSPFTAGHRGIDVATRVGTPVLAAAPGVVSFAGPVGGRLFVSVDSGGGVIASYSFLATVRVRTGDVVARGQTVGTSGLGHAGVDPPHLHFGVRLDGVYQDPMAYLAAPDLVALVRLAPLDG